VRKGGQDETDLRVIDVANHRELSDHFPLSLYRGFAFRKDGKSFYYTVENRELGQRVLYHVLGTEIGKDTEVFKQPADTWVEPEVSEDGRYLRIDVQHGWSQGEVYVENLKANKELQPVVKGLKGNFHASLPETFCLCRQIGMPRRVEFNHI
jgi:protease II